jgi:hypothetical protein
MLDIGPELTHFPVSRQCTGFVRGGAVKAPTRKCLVRGQPVLFGRLLSRSHHYDFADPQALIVTKPFEYVHTPKHGFWLSLIECVFWKMACTFLRHIRVTSMPELKARILKSIDEMNAGPAIFRWKNFDLEPA